MTSVLTCGFIGLGLIGGSIARALKKYDSEIQITAYDINREALALARKEQIVDIAAESIDESFSSCDYLFLCAPVRKNDSNLMEVRNFLSDSCILTDVGSVKATIHAAVREAGLEHCFVGGHPMAGSERVGFSNSKAELLENAYYILTPSPSVPKEGVDRLRGLVSGMGAIPLVLNPADHDYITAAVSHLPHVAASSLVNLVRDSDSADGIMKLIAAGGFKDITRIASSSAAMWQQICLTNTDNVTALLEDYIDALSKIKEQIARKDAAAIYSFFDEARIYRDSFIDASAGPIKRAFRVNVDIADRAGALAHIAAVLAENSISIKNIGITHNRESEDGVLHLEFYTKEGMNAAVGLMAAHHYTVHHIG